MDVDTEKIVDVGKAFDHAGNLVIALAPSCVENVTNLHKVPNDSLFLLFPTLLAPAEKSTPSIQALIAEVKQETAIAYAVHGLADV